MKPPGEGSRGRRHGWNRDDCPLYPQCFLVYQELFPTCVCASRFEEGARGLPSVSIVIPPPLFFIRWDWSDFPAATGQELLPGPWAWWPLGGPGMVPGHGLLGICPPGSLEGPFKPLPRGAPSQIVQKERAALICRILSNNFPPRTAFLLFKEPQPEKIECRLWQGCAGKRTYLVIQGLRRDSLEFPPDFFCILCLYCSFLILSLEVVFSKVPEKK